jgi:hypothetical protein
MDRLDSALLFSLSRRCLMEWPSRMLDGKIYCAVHGKPDANDLSTTRRIDARANGLVVIRQDGVAGWVEAPLFTLELDRATSLLPSGLVTISRDPMIVCATALGALALISRTTDRFTWPHGSMPHPRRHGGD